jgi:hypothetical protein
MTLAAAPGAARDLATESPQAPAPAASPDTTPPYLRDRGPGIATSMFGTYVRPGELLVYPFVELYWDSNFEYKPSELGYGLDVDYRGEYEATEGLVFLGYGLSSSFAVELEAAYISAELEKAASDPSAMPEEFAESGLGDVEGQIRWRWQRESATRPEFFTYFETVFPLQKNRKLIGTQDWEWKLGSGVTRGFPWGTGTFRLEIEYSREEGKFEAGEYAFEYLRRLSQRWRIVALIEGYQIDEVELITEAQWQIHPRAFFKANMGWGLTENAVDLAPEFGLMMSF